MFKANRFGLIGIVIATIGTAIAIAQDHLRVKFTPESPKLVGQVVDKGFNLFRKDDVVVETHDRIDYIYIGLGLVSLVLGVWSFIVKENHRVSGLAGALGVVAMAWEYVLIGVVLAVVGFFLVAFS